MVAVRKVSVRIWVGWRVEAGGIETAEHALVTLNASPSFFWSIEG